MAILAYKRTEETIAKTHDSSRLTFSAVEFNDLTILPTEIGALTALPHLELHNTQVSDIAALANPTKLTDLILSGKPVSDLSPLLSLTQLAENPDLAGLRFQNMAATKTHPHIAKIAGIDDNAKRATDFFASLKDLGDTSPTQYNTLLSTRLMRASIDDFQFDDLTRLMRLMPIEEDLRRLRDPVQLVRFLEDAEDLRNGIRTLCKTLTTPGGNMQRKDIIPYLEGVIKELDHAKESDELRTAKVIEYGGVLENFSLDAATRAKLGKTLSKALSQQVNNLLELTRSHFADTFLRLAPLHDIEMAPSQTLAQALGQVEALLRDTRAAAQHDLVPLAPEDDAIFTHMMRSLEKLTRAHGQAPSDSDRAIYQREIDCHLAMITVSLKLYITKGRHHMGNLGSYIDVVLQQVKRAKNLQEILNMTKKFCMPPQRDRKYANFRNSRSFIMSDHSATITWGRGDATFSDGKYSRAHRWQFDGGISVIASASPDVVPLPFSRAYAVDPEEAFVGTLASCHMLWFLDLARQATFIADSYRDQARGEMRKTDDGGFWIQAVHLHPQTSWQGDAPDPIKLSDLHHLANDNCFIADSVKSDIVTHLGQS